MLPLQSTGEVQITEATPPKPPREAGPLDPRVVFWGLRSMATARGLSLPRERANGPGQDTENTKAETKLETQACWPRVSNSPSFRFQNGVCASKTQ